MVFDFNISLNDVAPLYQMKFTVDCMEMKKSGLFMNAICVLFLLFTLPRFNFVSVVFDFNASLIDVPPLSPMLLPVDLRRMEKSRLLADVICVVSFVLTKKVELSECCV